jgi:hypothetical protein
VIGLVACDAAERGNIDAIRRRRLRARRDHDVDRLLQLHGRFVTPLGGAILLVNMALGEIVFGGLGPAPCRRTRLPSRCCSSRPRALSAD